MPQVLVFTLAAPLASWGVGGAARRPSEDVPTWSAVVGLLGAALGYARTDERLSRLAATYTLAVRVEREGERLWDYHTVQTPHEPALKGRAAGTRAEELQAVNPDGVPWTNISRREYIADGSWSVAVWPLTDHPDPSPEDLARALEEPVYPLYAGRRGCLLAAPLRPQVKDAQHLAEVLEPTGRLCWDVRIPGGPVAAAQVRERRDLLLSPSRRTFGVRQEAFL